MTHTGINVICIVLFMIHMFSAEDASCHKTDQECGDNGKAVVDFVNTPPNRSEKGQYVLTITWFFNFIFLERV